MRYGEITAAFWANERCANEYFCLFQS